MAQQTLVPVGRLPNDSFDAMSVRGNYAFTTGFGVLLASYDLQTRYRLGVLPAEDARVFGYHVALVGDYAYVLTALEGAPGSPGIIVVDITNPSNPRRVGVYSAGGSFDGFVVNGNIAYTSRGSQLHVLNLSNPANPQLVRTVSLSGALAGTGGTVVGNRLYLCEGTAGFSVWDVSQPDNPTRLGILTNLGVVRDCVIEGNYAFLSCGKWLGGVEGALRVVDISNPSNMSVVAEIRLGSPPFYAMNPWYPLVRKGNHLFVGVHDENSVSIVDISNPSSPQVRGSIDGHGVIGGAYLPNNQLVTLTKNTFSVWDITNAQSPSRVGSYFGISPYAATRVGNWLITAEQGGVATYDVTIPSNLSRAGYTTLPNSPTGNQRIVVQGNLAAASFLFGRGQEVHLLNAANLPALLPVGSYSPNTNVYGVALQLPFMLVAHTGGLDVVRVENPAMPMREGRIPSDYTNYPVDVATGSGVDGFPIACLVTYDRKLKLYFTGELPLIHEEGVLDLPFRPSDVEIAGNLALVAGNGKLLAVDISQRTNPRQVALWEYSGAQPGGATRVQVYGNTALLSYYWGLAVFDLNQVPNLTPVAVYDGRVDDAILASSGDVVVAVSSSQGVVALQGRLPEGTSDLQLRAVRFSPSDPADLMDGVTLSLEAEVFNAGPENTLAPTVRFVLDGQTVDARVRATNLAAGQAGVAVARVTLRAGSGRTLQAIVDPNQQWNDPIRANNTRSVPFPDLNRPDLSVAEVQIQPQSGLVHGEEFTVRALVRNTGGGLARPVEVVAEYGGRIVRSTVNGLRTGAQESVVATFTAAAGQTQVRVKVDPANSIHEETEENNELLLSTPAIATPDLEVVQVTFAPTQPDEGDTVRVTAKVRNNGAPYKGVFVVGFYVDNQLIYNEPSPLPNLDTGQEMEVSQHFTFRAGSSQLRAIADPANQVVESNEDNNTGTATLPQPPAPELEVRSLTLAQPMQAGIWQTAQAEIANSGGTARNVKVQFLVNGTPISTQTVYALRRSTSTRLEASWQVRPGTREVKVVVDPEGETSDPQRENNSRALSTDVPAAEVSLESVQLPPADPNLIVGDYPLTGQVPVRLRVRNSSDVGTGTVQAGVFADGQYVAGTNVSLAGREAKQVEVYVPLRSLLGKAQLRAVVDVNNYLLEQNEADNEKTATIPQWRLPDLEVVDVTWSPQEFSIGQTVTFNITVRNRGEGRYGIIAWGGRQQRLPVTVNVGAQTVAAAEQLVGVLVPGASQTVQVSWRATPVDNPQVEVRVDSQEWLPEADENNNTLRKPMQRRLTSPDFAVTDLEVTPTTGLHVGDPVTIRATVAHVDGEFNGITELVAEAYVDGRQLSTQQVSLRSGEQKPVEFRWQALPGAAREVRVALRRHPWETNEANNEGQITVPLQVAPVDLVVDEISDSLPSQLVEGDTVTTRVTVRNAGSGDIRLPITVALYVNGSWTGSERLNGLAAGETRTLNFSWAAFRAEQLELVAVADADGQVPGEADETNNRLRRRIATQVVARQEVSAEVQPLSLRAAAGATVLYRLRIANSSSQPRSLRVQLLGLDGLQVSVQPAAANLQPRATSTHTVQVQIPAEVAAGGREFTVRILNEDDTLITDRRAALEVTREPQITALSPANGTRTGNTSVVFTWRTDVFSSSEVFLRALDESSYRQFTGSEGTEHQVRVDGLQRGKTYRFYVVSRTPQGTAQSEERSLTVTEAVAFAQREYRFTLDKDFDQRVQLQLRNLSTEPQTVRVELVNPYDDVPAGFIGAGGDQPITVAANSTQEVTLALHFQTASRNRYTFVARLHGGEGANTSVDEVPVHVTVDDNVDIEVQDLGTDPVTLQKTIRIVNRRNKPVAGLTLKLSDSLQGQVSLDKELQGFRLGPYESVTVRIQPTFAIQISRYPELQARLSPGRAVLIDVPEARQQLRQRRQGSVQVVDNANRVRAELHNVDFTPPAGKQLYAVQLDNRVLEYRNQTASCSNQERIQIPFNVQPLEPGDPFLLVDMRPAKGWSLDQISPQTAYFYVNGHLVGKIENTVPDGLYLFDVPAHFLRLGDFPTTNTVTMQWYLPNGGHFLQVANVRLVIFAKRMVQYVAAESEEEALRIAQNQPFFNTHNDPIVGKALKRLQAFGEVYRANWETALPFAYPALEPIIRLFGKESAGEITDVMYGLQNFAVFMSSALVLLVVPAIATGQIPPRMLTSLEEFDCVGATRQVLNEIQNMAVGKQFADLRFAAVYTAKGNSPDVSSHNYVLIWDAKDPVNTAHIVDFWNNQAYEARPLLQVLQQIKNNPNDPLSALYNRFMPGTLAMVENFGDRLAITYDDASKADTQVMDVIENAVKAVWGSEYRYVMGTNLPGTRGSRAQTRSIPRGAVKPPIFGALVNGSVWVTLRNPTNANEVAGVLPDGSIVDDFPGSRVYSRGTRTAILLHQYDPNKPYRLELLPRGTDATTASILFFYPDVDRGEVKIELYENVPVTISRQGTGARIDFDPSKATQTVTLANGDTVYPTQVEGAAQEGSITSESRRHVLTPGLHLLAFPSLQQEPLASMLEQGRAARWNPDKPGNNKYELFPYPYVSTAQRGAGYWVRLDRTTPVTITVPTVEIEPYVLSLRPGWNMIGNPYIDPVVWDASAIRVRKDGVELPLSQAEAQGWVEGYAWRWDGNAYRLVYSTGTPLPNVDEALPAWAGAWVFAYQPCELILPIPQGRAAEVTRKQNTIPTGAWSIALRAKVGDSTGEVLVGALPSGRGLSVGVPPLPPGVQEGVQVVAVRNGQPLAADLRNGTRIAGEAWDIEVRVPAGEHDTATLWWQDVHRAPRSVQPVLVDLQTGERKFLRHTSSHTFAVSRQGGVYRFRVELLPTGDLLRITGLRVSGGRSQGSYTVSFHVNVGAQVEVTVLSAGKPVRKLMQTVTRSAGVQQVSWDGRDANGIALPAGAYLVEVKATGVDGQVARATVPIVLTR